MHSFINLIEKMPVPKTREPQEHEAAAEARSCQELTMNGHRLRKALRNQFVYVPKVLRQEVKEMRDYDTYVAAVSKDSLLLRKKLLSVKRK